MKSTIVKTAPHGMRAFLTDATRLAGAISLSWLGRMPTSAASTPRTAADAIRAGVIKTTVGGGPIGSGGLAKNATMSTPFSVSTDSANNLYICDNYYHSIYKVDPNSRILTRIAGRDFSGYSGDGGPATQATFAFPYAVVWDGCCGFYVADTGNYRVRYIDAASGLISTVAGNGGIEFNGDGIPALAASLPSPQGIAVDRAGNLYISDTLAMRIRVVNRSATPLIVFPRSTTPVVIQPGYIATVAGTSIAGFAGDGGFAPAAQLNVPWGMAFDLVGNLHIADYYNHRVRRIDALTGTITTVAGTGDRGNTGDGGNARNARICFPCNLVFDKLNNFYIGQQQTSRVRKVNTSTGIISTVAGLGGYGEGGDGGPAIDALLSSPTGVALDSRNNLYIAEYNNARVRRVEAASQIISTYAGSLNVGEGGPALQATLNQPCGFTFGPANQLFITDQGNHRIRVVGLDGIIRRVVGTGIAGFNGDGMNALQAQVFHPADVKLDRFSNIYICDRGNARIRKVDSQTHLISTIVGTGIPGYGGDDGPATRALLDNPRAIALDANGNLYIAELATHRVRFVNLGAVPVILYSGSANAIAIGPGIIKTIAGTGVSGTTGNGGPAISAAISSPRGVTIDTRGNLYITEGGRDPQNFPSPDVVPDSLIRKVDAQTGIITTIAGTTQAGYNGDGIPATEALLNGPRNVAVDSAGNFYISDSLNSRVRFVNVETGLISTIAGNGTCGFAGDGGRTSEAVLCVPRYVELDRAGNLYIADVGNSRIRKVTFR